MCFSATASFSVAAATTAAGLATLRHVRDPREVPLALIPLLFAAQQAIEGLLWLQLDGADDALTIAALSLAFLLFAKVLWPTYVAVAVLLVETNPRRRAILCVLSLMGLGLSVDLLLDLIDNPAVATIRGHSIAYVSNLSGTAGPSALIRDALPYLVCTGAPPFVSSHAAIRVFGAVILVGFAVAASIYLGAFVSVWCFFAAADSTVLYFYFRRAAFGARPHPQR